MDHIHGYSVARSTDISVFYEFMESRGNQRSWVEDFLHGLAANVANVHAHISITNLGC